MFAYYMDSSGLVKRYIAEVGSTWLRGITDPAAGNDIYIGRITTVEIVAALTRRARSGTISVGDAAAACLLFRNDLSYDYEILEITEALVNHAMQLAEIHGLRGYDAVQLAAACETNVIVVAQGLPPITFISADNELNAAAVSEGLAVENPNSYP